MGSRQKENEDQKSLGPKTYIPFAQRMINYGDMRRQGAWTRGSISWDSD